LNSEIGAGHRLKNVFSFASMLCLPRRRDRRQEETGAAATTGAAVGVGAPVAAVALTAAQTPVAGSVDAERQGV